MADDFSARYGDLLNGSYDCVDRIVLNAYYPMGHGPGGFRVWWRRLHDGSEEQLDDNHLMRMAGRFARRVKAWAAANDVPVIYCKSGERKHRIAEEYLATHDSVRPGVFMVLAAKAPAAVWQVHRSASGVIGNLAKKYSYVNHYSFHIMDPQWGHVTIKMSGHPPFAAQVMLNGHEFVACQARAADTLSQPATTGRLSQVCNRWIYTACLCFGLDTDEVLRSGFGYAYSVYQVEYSRNLLFADGKRMQRLFDTVVDRTRSRLNVTRLRTMFGAKQRPHHDRAGGPPRLAAMIETPVYDLTNFKVHFGRLTLKAYTKGEHVLRFEAIVHNTRELNCRRRIDMFGEVVNRLAGMAQRFCTALDCVDIGFLPDHTLDELPTASQIGATRGGGIDLNRARMRNALAAVLVLAAAPNGFTVTGFAEQVRVMTGQNTTEYSTRHASYDLRKIRGKHPVDKPGRTRRYHVPPEPARTIAALLTLRAQVIAPII